MLLSDGLLLVRGIAQFVERKSRSLLARRGRLVCLFNLLGLLYA